MKTTFNPLSLLKNSTILSISGLLLLSFPVAEGKLLARELKQVSNNQVAQNAAVPSSFEDYRRECMQETRSRLPRSLTSLADDICNCTIKNLQSRYNFPQFRTLYVKYKKNNQDPAAQPLIEVGETCADQYLFQ